jgi:hypothetical protein
LSSFSRALLIGVIAVGVLVTTFFLTSALDAGRSISAIVMLCLAAIVFYALQEVLKSGNDAENDGERAERSKQSRENLREKVRISTYSDIGDLIPRPLKEQLPLKMEPKEGLVHAPDPKDEPGPLSPTDDIVEALESSNRRLLLVGEPGSGKTMATYRLIQHLDDCEGDERIPLLVNASAWEGQENFNAFLIDYLCSEVGYDAPKPFAEKLVEERQFWLVLDGLDEIPDELKESFCERLNAFLKQVDWKKVAVVVTCRIYTYRKLPKLKLLGAFEMRPLDDPQLNSALETLCDKRPHERKNWEKPLFLTLTVEGGVDPGKLLACVDKRKLPNLVIDEYIDHELEEGPEKARNYLSWMAGFLGGKKKSPFDCTRTDPAVFALTDLTPPAPPVWYRLGWGGSWGWVLG